jgi:hypothetical protein
MWSSSSRCPSVEPVGLGIGLPPRSKIPALSGAAQRRLAPMLTQVAVAAYGDEAPPENCRLYAHKFDLATRLATVTAMATGRRFMFNVGAATRRPRSGCGARRAARHTGRHLRATRPMAPIRPRLHSYAWRWTKNHGQALHRLAAVLTGEHAGNRPRP